MNQGQEYNSGSMASLLTLHNRASFCFRAFLKVVLLRLYGDGSLECGLGALKTWSTFSLSYDSYFAVVYLCLGLYMFHVKFREHYNMHFNVELNNGKLQIKFSVVGRMWSPKKLTLGVVNLYHSIVWSLKISLK